MPSCHKENFIFFTKNSIKTENPSVNMGRSTLHGCEKQKIIFRKERNVWQQRKRM